MSDTSYSITSVGPSDHYIRAEVDALLEQEGIHRDRNLDYTAAMLDDDYHVIATGSCFGNTLRCMAVSSAHQGESLMNAIVSHIVEYQYSRGNYHLFLYTKCNSARFFGSLGFSVSAGKINGRAAMIIARASRRKAQQCWKHFSLQRPMQTAGAEAGRTRGSAPS